MIPEDDTKPSDGEDTVLELLEAGWHNAQSLGPSRQVLWNATSGQQAALLGESLNPLKSSSQHIQQPQPTELKGGYWCFENW